MENEQKGDENRGRYEQAFSKVLLYFGLVGVLASLVSFYLILPSTLSGASQISRINPYTYFLLNVTPNGSAVVAVAIVSAIILTGAVATLFVGREDISVGTRISNRLPFFAYLSMFILLELVLSIISPLISNSYANDPVLKLPLFTQNFIFSASSISQALILQFVPISVMSLVYLAVKRKLSLKSFLNPDRSLKGVELTIVVISAVFAAVLVSGDPGAGVVNFLSFLVMDYIYIRFGLLRAIISGFTIGEYNIILQFSQSPVIPTVMYVFLIIWGMIGVYSSMQLIGRLVERRQKSVQRQTEHLSEASPEESGGEISGTMRQSLQPSTARSQRKPENFWVRSVCPSCGGVTFNVREDMSLECKSCHQAIGKDEEGEFNIRIVGSRF